MKIFIKNRVRQKVEFQFFMHQMVEACIKNGFKSKPDIFFSYKYHIRSFCKRLLFFVYLIVKWLFPSLIKRKQALLVTANGGTLLENVFPYYFNYEIIPMLWDVWPSKWPVLYKDLKLFDCKVVFVTVRAVAEKINKELPIKAYWVPEGIDVCVYNKGSNLEDRTNTVLELGRQKKDYHIVLQKLNNSGKLVNYSASKTLPNGMLDVDNLLFKTNEEMIRCLPTYKIMICFPQTDTNPERAGDVETLTQRYWEAMLCRCVLVGRAPQELIDFIGYNPVIDVDWRNPELQIMGILDDVSSYQPLVDKNYEIATRKASWDNRIQLIKKCLLVSEYTI